MINRTVLLSSLLRKFNIAFDKAIAGFAPEERIHVTETLMEISKLYRDIQENQWLIQSIQSELLKKYRKKLKPVIDTELYIYFDRESVLMHKGIDSKDKYFYTDDEFNDLSGEEQILSEKEYEQFIERINNHMAKERQELYLSLDPEKTEGQEIVSKISPVLATPPSMTSTSATDDDEYITSKEAAALLKVSKVTLNKWKLEGRIKFYRIGTRVRFKKSEVVAAMKEGLKPKGRK